MSRQLLSQYQARLERLVQYGGSRNETSVRAAFQELLDRYAASKNLALVTELDYKTTLGTTVRPDGTLKNAVRQDVGYWSPKASATTSTPRSPSSSRRAIPTATSSSTTPGRSC